VQALANLREKKEKGKVVKKGRWGVMTEAERDACETGYQMKVDAAVLLACKAMATRANTRLTREVWTALGHHLRSHSDVVSTGGNGSVPPALHIVQLLKFLLSSC
jgi:hypothetical protein